MVEVVVSRYCEPMEWLPQLSSLGEPTLPVTIYDKSAGGPRQRIHLGGWSSADGPDGATVWPGAIALPNVGCEAHAHMHHIIERWDSLADRTFFISADAPGHVPDILARMATDIRGGVRYAAYGDKYTCDGRGLPNVTGGFDELQQAYRIFFPTSTMPDLFHWTGFSMYLVGHERIRRFTKQQWMDARDWCTTKAASLAMERLYDLLFS